MINKPLRAPTSVKLVYCTTGTHKYTQTNTWIATWQIQLIAVRRSLPHDLEAWDQPHLLGDLRVMHKLLPFALSARRHTQMMMPKWWYAPALVIGSACNVPSTQKSNKTFSAPSQSFTSTVSLVLNQQWTLWSELSHRCEMWRICHQVLIPIHRNRRETGDQSRWSTNGWNWSHGTKNEQDITC